VDERPSYAAISIGEWVDGLELGMCKRRMRQDGKVIASHEFHEVIDGGRNASVLRWHELSPVRTESTAPNPHLLVPPLSSRIGIVIVQKCVMHRQD
jgi:hypothetical protein